MQYTHLFVCGNVRISHMCTRKSFAVAPNRKHLLGAYCLKLIHSFLWFVFYLFWFVFRFGVLARIARLFTLIHQKKLRFISSLFIQSTSLRQDASHRLYQHKSLINVRMLISVAANRTETLRFALFLSDACAFWSVTNVWNYYRTHRPKAGKTTKRTEPPQHDDFENHKNETFILPKTLWFGNWPHRDDSFFFFFSSAFTVNSQMLK